jgi:uncharacterized membrane protein
MERMLVVVFETEKKAYEGADALSNLDTEGSIAIHAESIIQKKADGRVEIKKTEENFPLGTFAGAAIGSVIGLLGGPAGMVAGGTFGATAGIVADVYRAGVNIDFLNDVSKQLTPGKFAVVADISEEWVTPVDSTMEALGGSIFRSSRASVETDQEAAEMAQMYADLEQLRAEYNEARAETKVKIQTKMDALKSKLNQKREYAQRRTAEIKKEADFKVNALQQKAAKAHKDRKAAFEARIAEIRENERQADAKLKHMLAEKMKKAAAQLEKAS